MLLNIPARRAAMQTSDLVRCRQPGPLMRIWIATPSVSQWVAR